VAYYRCVSRIVDRRFVLEAREKEIFVRIMRGYEAYCGVRIITFCVMSNHFHILLEVPRRPSKERLPTDAELTELLRKAQCSFGASTLAQRLEMLRASGDHQRAEVKNVRVVFMVVFSQLKRAGDRQFGSGDRDWQAGQENGDREEVLHNVGVGGIRFPVKLPPQAR
jgi:hypothetical protein